MEKRCCLSCYPAMFVNDVESGRDLYLLVVGFCNKLFTESLLMLLLEKDMVGAVVAIALRRFILELENY